MSRNHVSFGLIFALMVTLAGCWGTSGEDEDPPTVMSPDCTADAGNLYRCNGEVVEQCNGSSWETVEDCEAAGKSCEQSGSGMARRRPARAASSPAPGWPGVAGWPVRPARPTASAIPARTARGMATAPRASAGITRSVCRPPAPTASKMATRPAPTAGAAVRSVSATPAAATRSSDSFSSVGAFSTSGKLVSV